MCCVVSQDSELDLHNRLRKKLSEDWKGWEIQEIVESKRPLHYQVLHHGKPEAKVFIYATDKQAIMYSNVDMVVNQLIDSRKKDKSIRAIIYATNKTRVPHHIENYANIYEIKIRRI